MASRVLSTNQIRPAWAQRGGGLFLLLPFTPSSTRRGVHAALLDTAVAGRAILRPLFRARFMGGGGGVRRDGRFRSRRSRRMGVPGRGPPRRRAGTLGIGGGVDDDVALGVRGVLPFDHVILRLQ